MTGRKRAAVLDAALKGMFKGLEDRGVPEHVMRVVDQLDAAAAGEAEPTPSPEPPRSRAPSRPSDPRRP